MKKFFAIACLSVALSANALPVNAQVPWRILRPFLQGLGSEVGRVMLDTILNPQDNAFAAFADDEWLVTISENEDDLIYYGVNLETENYIIIQGVTEQGNNQRRVLSWNNGNYRYQVAYQPNDPGVIRLQVFEREEELLNRLLYRYQPDS